MCCRARKRRTVMWKRTYKWRGSRSVGTMNTVSVCRNGSGVVGNRHSMDGQLYATYGRARGAGERATDKTLAIVCMHSCIQCTDERESAATCGRCDVTTSQKHTHANEVAAPSLDGYYNSRFVATCDPWKGRESEDTL
jgi:hypothetical protein